LANYFLKDAQFCSSGKISLGSLGKIFCLAKTKQFYLGHAFKKQFAKIIALKNFSK
jgi:hypothetical protein